MEKENIFQIIRNEVDDYVFNTIEIVEGYYFSTYQTIKRNHLYINSQFQNKTPYNNRERIFFNVVKPVCLLASRAIDLDTKNIVLQALNPTSEYATFLLRKEIEYWCKRNNIDHLLNQIADELPVYGSAVIKKTKKGATLVDLRRLFLDPTVEDISNSRFITIKHYLTTSQLRAKVKDGWDKDAIDKLILNHRNRTMAPQSYERSGQLNAVVSTPYIEVYERYGELKSDTLNDDGNDEYVRSLVIAAQPFNVSISKDGMREENGIILFKSEWKKDYPFQDFHYYKTRGRWLGVGVIEDLFSAQERRNEMANQKRVAMEISSMVLMQSDQPTIVSNVLTDTQSGDVLVNANLQPVANEQRSLAAFGQEEQLYDGLAKNITFSYDAFRGEALPASTPATNAVIQNQNAGSVYVYKQKSFANGFRQFMNEYVLPQVIKDLTNEHILAFTGTVDELDKFDTIHAQSIVNKLIIKNLLDGKPVYAGDKAKMFTEAVNSLKKRGAQRFVNIKDDLFADPELEYDFNIIGEQQNQNVMAQNLQNFMGSLRNIDLNDPVMRAFVIELAKQMNIDPIKINLAMNDREQKMSTQGPQAVSPIMSNMQVNPKMIANGLQG